MSKASGGIEAGSIGCASGTGGAAGVEAVAFAAFAGERQYARSKRPAIAAPFASGTVAVPASAGPLTTTVLALLPAGVTCTRASGNTPPSSSQAVRAQVDALQRHGVALPARVAALAAFRDADPVDAIQRRRVTGRDQTRGRRRFVDAIAAELDAQSRSGRRACANARRRPSPSATRTSPCPAADRLRCSPARPHSPPCATVRADRAWCRPGWNAACSLVGGAIGAGLRQRDRRPSTAIARRGTTATTPGCPRDR